MDYWLLLFFFFWYSLGSSSSALSFVVPVPLPQSIIRGLVPRVNVVSREAGEPIHGASDVRGNPLHYNQKCIFLHSWSPNKIISMTLGFIMRASSLCHWRSTMWFNHTSPTVNLKYVLTQRRHKNPLSDVHEVPGMVKAILISLATLDKRSRRCLPVSPKMFLLVIALPCNIYGHTTV